MVGQPKIEAWNNFVVGSEPRFYDAGSKKRAAAIANQYLELANNGGLNSFLTVSWDLDANEILEALISIGAPIAAKELGNVLRRLGVQLLPSSQDTRWELLDRHWTEALNEYDVLSEEADADLMSALSHHVSEHEDFYLNLKSGE